MHSSFMLSPPRAFESCPPSWPSSPPGSIRPPTPDQPGPAAEQTSRDLAGRLHTGNACAHFDECRHRRPGSPPPALHIICRMPSVHRIRWRLRMRMHAWNAPLKVLNGPHVSRLSIVNGRGSIVITKVCACGASELSMADGVACRSAGTHIPAQGGVEMAVAFNASSGWVGAPTARQSQHNARGNCG